MKKILIVNDNLHLGGIQKALVNMLKEIHDEYEITLLLLNKRGELLSEIPNDVNVVGACKTISVLGAYKKELKENIAGYIWKGILVLLARKSSKKFAFQFAAIMQKKIGITYDVAISYSHPSKEHDLRSCSAEFVLKKINAKKKICFVHADYQNESNRSSYTDSIYKQFDGIACCSESVRNHFVGALPDDTDKVSVVRNFYDLSLQLNDGQAPYQYDNSYINIVSVARLTTEKGISRAVKALYQSGRKDIRYYIVGEGPKRKELETEIAEYKLADKVFLLGESTYPYAYMKSADYLLVSSFHEAAPMVFDEAKLLGLKVITTNTTSAMEMIGTEYGVVCENSMEGIRDILTGLQRTKAGQKTEYNNDTQQMQFAELVQK